MHSEHGTWGSGGSLRFKIRKVAVLVAPSPLGAGRVPDSGQSARGVRYRLTTLLAIGGCASTAGHNSLAAVAE
ncbi:hypothetical protein [Streptomyces sp. NPDC000880]